MSTATQPRVLDSTADHASQWLASIGYALASLKLTVTLFAAGMVLVFVGTLAQDEQNMLEVKRDYFNSWIALIPFDVFVPQPFNPHTPAYLGGWGIPFPGGALIGALLLVNLIAAKLLRFQLSASGGRLVFGIGLSLLGLVMIVGVILAAQAGEGLQGKPPLSSAAIWNLMKVIVLVAGCGLAWQANQWRKHRVLRMVAYASAGILIALSVGLFGADWRPSDPSLRILWQLLQAGLVGVPLLLGFVVAFGRRGGNVLIHFGVGLMMLGQFIFGDRQLEQRLTLVEQEATNVLYHLDSVELAVIDRSDPESDHVISIPASRLVSALDSGKSIQDDRLPFSIEVLRYFQNSGLVSAKETSDNLATDGYGLELAAEEKKAVGGAESNMNLASAYVRLLDRDKTSIGTYLLSQFISDSKLLRGNDSEENESVSVGEKPYLLGLRFTRIPKPFWIKLDDVRRDNYSGSETPRDYSSEVRLVDPATGEVCRERIWMNNPLRYRGETYYQSNYEKLANGKEMTGLQVVANDGWMIPYISCMLVLMGMVVHFSDTLVRFVGREERAQNREKLADSLRGVLPVFGISALLVLGMIWPRSSGPKGFDFYKAGQIPVSFGGRVMPLDALAQQTLQAASNKTALPLTKEDRATFNELDPGRSLSALQWLLEIASGSERANEIPLFRIDAQEILNDLDIVRRQNHRYSVTALRAVAERLTTLVEEASKAKTEHPEELTFKQKKLLELDQRIRAYTLLEAAFAPINPPPLPTQESSQNDPELAMRQLSQWKALVDRVRRVEAMNAAAILPPAANITSDPQGNRPAWQQLCSGRLEDSLRAITSEGEISPAQTTLEAVLTAYSSGQPQAFNQAVEEHLQVVQAAAPSDFHAGANRVERWLRAADPCGKASMLYILMALLTLVGFLWNGAKIRPVVLGAMVVLLALHTVALVARIYVTGRPPVINLYSSAVFIGWAVVIAGILFELIFRSGIGNLVSSIAGGATLMVAYGLDEGDTLGVLQAVLDTQFWLSTHVITIALGYSATFLAGLLGIIHLAIRAFSSMNVQKQSLAHDVHRMTYGVVCFGILFSFVGTVLGGLWADDSWGRFWGWDPKENGALLIVIWNALVLHARWDRMVGERGFAMLAVVGNIVTAWSWFGTNQLGIGLHSYGFTSGVLLGLGAFALSQIAIIVAGLLWIRSDQRIA